MPRSLFITCVKQLFDESAILSLTRLLGLRSSGTAPRTSCSRSTGSSSSTVLGDSDDKGTCLIYTTCSCRQGRVSLDALLRVAATGSRVLLSGNVRIVNRREDYFEAAHFQAIAGYSLHGIGPLFNVCSLSLPSMLGLAVFTLLLESQFFSRGFSLLGVLLFGVLDFLVLLVVLFVKYVLKLLKLAVRRVPRFPRLRLLAHLALRKRP